MNDQIIENQVRDEVTNYPATVMTLTVTDQDTFGAAGEAIKTLKGFRKEITDFFGPMKKKAFEAHKLISTKEKETLAPLDKAEAFVRGRMNVFLTEQERIRVADERKALLKAQEEERKEKKRLEQRAEKALESGKDEKAEALLEEAEDVYVAPVETIRTIAPVKTATAHVGMRDKLVVQVLDLKVFVKELCAKDSALSFLKVEQKTLEAWVKSNEIERFAGLRIEKTKVANIR